MADHRKGTAYSRSAYKAMSYPCSIATLVVWWWRRLVRRPKRVPSSTSPREKTTKMNRCSISKPNLRSRELVSTMKYRSLRTSPPSTPRAQTTPLHCRGHYLSSLYELMYQLDRIRMWGPLHSGTTQIKRKRRATPGGIT